MSRRDGLSPEDRRIWARVTGTVTPPKSRKPERVEAVVRGSPPVPRTDRTSAPPAARAPGGSTKPAQSPSSASAPSSSPRPRNHPEALEPRRQRRLARERDPIEARIDLHGHGRFQAQDALTAFLEGAQARGFRSVLVITGQGRRGGTGVIRASVHEWLQSPALRGVVAGFAPAARRHGGDGALYVTLKRR